MRGAPSLPFGDDKSHLCISFGYQVRDLINHCAVDVSKCISGRLPERKELVFRIDDCRHRVPTISFHFIHHLVPQLSPFHERAICLFSYINHFLQFRQFASANAIGKLQDSLRSGATHILIHRVQKGPGASAGRRLLLFWSAGQAGMVTQHRMAETAMDGVFATTGQRPHRKFIFNPPWEQVSRSSFPWPPSS